MDLSLSAIHFVPPAGLSTLQIVLAIWEADNPCTSWKFHKRWRASVNRNPKTRQCSRTEAVEHLPIVR